MLGLKKTRNGERIAYNFVYVDAYVGPCLIFFVSRAHMEDVSTFLVCNKHDDDDAAGRMGRSLEWEKRKKGRERARERERERERFTFQLSCSILMLSLSLLSCQT